MAITMCTQELQGKPQDFQVSRYPGHRLGPESYVATDCNLFTQLTKATGLSLSSSKGKLKVIVRTCICSTVRLKMKVVKKEETKRLSYSEAVTQLHILWAAEHVPYLGNIR